MFFIGLGTATPPTRYTQAECWQALKAAPQFAALDRRAKATLQHVLTHDSGITTRALSLTSLADVFALDPDTLHHRFATNAPALAAAAARQALNEAGLAAHAVDALVISTCTGYLCPGLTSYVGEMLGMRPDVLALDLVGQGCGAAIPNLRTAQALLTSGDCGKVLSICVEVSSAAFYLDNDPGVLISACLFGDGAGAAVLSGSPVSGARAVEWRASNSRHDPGERDTLRFEQKQGLLRNILQPQVPELAAHGAREVLVELLAHQGLHKHEIAAWIWHGGGRKVIEALCREIELTAEDLQWSAQVLSAYGNISSASVYFTLQAALQGNARGGWWWMSSFGAGFSCHGALLEVA